MVTYLLIAGAIFFGSAFLGMHPLGAALIPIPVGVYLARGKLGYAAGLVMVSGLAAFVMLDTPRDFLYHSLIAMAGIPLGWGIARRWNHSNTVAVMAVFASAATLTAIFAVWPEWVDSCRQLIDGYAAGFQENVTGENAETTAVLLAYADWLKAHWPELGLGMVFWSVLVHVCVTFGLTASLMRRRFNCDGLTGWFSRLRPTEWLVWAVILVALLWFVEQARPELIDRFWVWNAAIALAGVYWLSGLSLLFYALESLRPHMFVYVAVVMLLTMSVWMHPMLCLVGLFDTWGNFRRGIDRAAAARKKRIEEINRMHNGD